MILEEVVTDTLASYRAKEGGREVLHTRALTHLLELCLHEVRDVLDLVDEGHDDALSWEFFGEALRPEAVLEVVVLDTAELLDRVIARSGWFVRTRPCDEMISPVQPPSKLTTASLSEVPLGL